CRQFNPSDLLRHYLIKQTIFIQRGFCPMKLSELLTVLPIYKTKNMCEQSVVRSVKMDNRQVSQDDLFVCIQGFTVDGHDFAENAVERGATVLVTERELAIENAIQVIVPNTVRALALLANKFYKYPTDKLRLVGITGTNGKTTTTYLLEKIFQHHKKSTGLIGTIQLKIGEQTKALKNTTPDALELQEYFAEMVEKEVDVAFMEVSSHALDLGRV